MDTKEQFKKVLKHKIKRVLVNDNVREVVNVFSNEFGENHVDINIDHLLNTEIDSNLDLLLYRARNIGVKPDYIASIREKFKNDMDTSVYELFYRDSSESDEFRKFYKEYLHRRLDEYPFIDIIIWFPNVTVRNEKGQSINIRDLYAKVTIRSDGRMSDDFKLIKTTFTQAEWDAGYVHSHLPRLYDVLKWNSPCLGSGPIIQPQDSLYTSNDSNLWGLFAYELKKYVGTESLAGGPYIRMSSVGANSSSELSKSMRFYHGKKDEIDNFLNYYSDKFDLHIAYNGNTYVLGESFASAAIKISKHYYDFVKHKFIGKNRRVFVDIFTNCIYSNGSLYMEGNITARRTPDKDTLFTFKDRDICIKLIAEDKNTRCVLLILNNEYLGAILFDILYRINTNYGNNRTKVTESEGTGSEPKESNKTRARTYYLQP